MDILIPILWAVLGVIFIIAEIFTTGFFLLWFGVGALAAALVGFVGAGITLQFLVFLTVTIVLTLLSRTIFTNYFGGKEPELFKTGVDALPGKVGVVVAESEGALDEGAVKVYGSTWRAFPAEGEGPLKLNEQVVVESVRGASVYVRPVSALPGWRTPELVAGSDERS